MSEIKQFRLLAECMSAGVKVVNSRGQITYANPSLLKMLGYSREQVVGRLLGEFVEQIPVRGEPQEVILLGSGRQRVVARWTSRPLIGRGGKEAGMLVVVEDLTELRHFEGQLRQAQKMEAVGRLVGGIVHDFNNLLTAIIGYSDLLASELPPNQAWHHKITEILKTAERAADLNRQLLNFIRQQEPQPRTLDLNAIVNGLKGMLNRLIGESIELSTVLDSSLGYFRADQSQIEQVILNLVVNSRDAIRETGRIVIETADLHLNEPLVRERYSIPAGRYVSLVVSDTGVRMEPETAGKVFNPFSTTKEEGKGTGIGLATAYRIVKQSCGFIEVNSSLGQGTVFRIYFPRVSREAVGVLPDRDRFEPAAG